MTDMTLFYSETIHYSDDDSRLSDLPRQSDIIR